MPNTLLTPLMITRKALFILHQKLNFVGNINRQYDNRFAKSGAKIGDTLNIRMPNKYTIRSGPVLNAQDTVEKQVPLTITNQLGVDMHFSSNDLTLHLDDFSERIIEPAMTVLAANVEAKAFEMMADIPNYVGVAGTIPNDLKTYLLAKSVLDNNLAPMSPRSFQLNSEMEIEIVDALKGLFQDSSSIASQYKEGKMGRTAGGDWYQNTLLTPQETGTALVDSFTVNGVQENGNVLNVACTGTLTVKKGQSFTIEDVFAVHPETKVVQPRLFHFVVAEDASIASTGELLIAPEMHDDTEGGLHNISKLPEDGDQLTLMVGTNPEDTIQQGMLFHKDCFTLATADLVMPKGVDFSAREVMDGISMRIIRQYDINTDNFPVRIDVLFGYKTLRNSQACRILS